MLEEQLLAQFARELQAEVLEKRADLEAEASLTEEQALAEVMLAYLEEAGLVEEHEFCLHEDATGRGRSKVTAYSLPDEGSRLELFTARFVPESEGEGLLGEEVARLAGRAARFFEYVAKKDFSRFSGAAAEAARRIARELERIEEVRVHVLTNATVRNRAIDEIEIEGRRVEFSVVDLERLYRASRDAITRDQIEVDFEKLLGRPLPCLEMKVRPKPAEYETFLIILSGDLIYQLYEQFGARLFEFNVRSFLQAKGKVNKGLRETLRLQPERFLAYNNGLTATADEIEIITFHGETAIKRIKGLQIVNGAQTTASIHRAKKVDKSDVSRVAVSMKLTRVTPEKLTEFVPLIAQFANTQNVIQIADLSANSPFHITLEQLSEKTWCPGEESRWFYERARGAYQAVASRVGTTPARKRDFDRECPKADRFSKTDVAKFLMSWWERPNTVSRGAQKNFAIFMADLPDRYPKDWLPDEEFYRYLISLAILFRASQSAIRKAKLQSYGANVATYMIAKLAHDHGERLKLATLWEQQEVSEELAKLFDDWAPRIHQALIQSAGRSNVTEWCKKEDCWEHIKTLDLAVGGATPVELRGEEEEKGAPSVVTKSDGHRRVVDVVATCCSVDSAEWAAVVAWAAKSGEVPQFEQRVANTLAGYALGGWRQRPSEKQARIAAKVLNAAVKHGIIDLSPA